MFVLNYLIKCKKKKLYFRIRARRGKKERKVDEEN